MGFSGGGSNILKAHKHTSAVQDGGKLDMDNVTEAELTQGDVIFSDGNALQRLAIGAATNTLVVNGAATAPEWAAGGGAPVVTTQSITPTNGQTATSATFVDVANASITLPTRAGGFCFISAIVSVYGAGSPTHIAIGLHHGGSLQEIQVTRCEVAANEYAICVTGMQALDGSVVKMQWKSNNTSTMVDVANFYSSRLQTFEAS